MSPLARAARTQAHAERQRRSALELVSAEATAREDADTAELRLVKSELLREHSPSPRRRLPPVEQAPPAMHSVRLTGEKQPLVSAMASSATRGQRQQQQQQRVTTRSPNGEHTPKQVHRIMYDRANHTSVEPTAFTSDYSAVQQQQQPKSGEGGRQVTEGYIGSLIPGQYVSSAGSRKGSSDGGAPAPAPAQAPAPAPVPAPARALASRVGSSGETDEIGPRRWTAESLERAFADVGSDDSDIAGYTRSPVSRAVASHGGVGAGRGGDGDCDGGVAVAATTDEEEDWSDSGDDDSDDGSMYSNSESEGEAEAAAGRVVSAAVAAAGGLVDAVARTHHQRYTGHSPRQAWVRPEELPPAPPPRRGAALGPEHSYPGEGKHSAEASRAQHRLQPTNTEQLIALERQQHMSYVREQLEAENSPLLSPGGRETRTSGEAGTGGSKHDRCGGRGEFAYVASREV